MFRWTSRRRIVDYTLSSSVCVVVAVVDIVIVMAHSEHNSYIIVI